SSVWAWRSLKIRSCFFRPLTPLMSSLRAISRRSLSVFVSNSATLLTGFSLMLLVACLLLWGGVEIVLASNGSTSGSSLRRMRGTHYSSPAPRHAPATAQNNRFLGRIPSDLTRPRSRTRGDAEYRLGASHSPMGALYRKLRIFVGDGPILV